MNEDVRVLYGASLQIPICVGSVALPLPFVSQLKASAAAVEAAEQATVVSSSAHDVQSASDSDATNARTMATSARKRARSGEGAETDERVPTTPSSATREVPVSLRYTHTRYCYVRDGGDMAYDAFCRWLCACTTSTRNASSCPEQAHVAKTNRSHDDITAPSSGDLMFGSVTTSEEAALAALVKGRPPSLFYGLVEKVEFVVPSSFPQPRRVLRRPPFVIEDLSWAEHLIEVHIHFLPQLAIPPVVLLHQAILNRRLPDTPVPALKSSTFELPRVPARVMPAFIPAPVTNEASAKKRKGSKAREDDAAQEKAGKEAALWQLVQGAVVSERKDTIRLLNPTTSVAAFVRLLHAKMADEDVIGPLFARFRDHFFGGEVPAREECDATTPLSNDHRNAEEGAVPVCLDAVPAYYTRLLALEVRPDASPLGLTAHSASLSVMAATSLADAPVAVAQDVKGHSKPKEADGGDARDEDSDDEEAATDWSLSPTLRSPLHLYHHSWDFPFEAAIYAYVTQRRRREAEGTMQAVVAQLRAEQADLAHQLRHLVHERLPASVAALHKELEAAYQHCLSLATTSASARNVKDEALARSTE